MAYSLAFLLCFNPAALPQTSTIHEKEVRLVVKILGMVKNFPQGAEGDYVVGIVVDPDSALSRQDGAGMLSQVQAGSMDLKKLKASAELVPISELADRAQEFEIIMLTKGIDAKYAETIRGTLIPKKNLIISNSTALVKESASVIGVDVGKTSVIVLNRKLIKTTKLRFDNSFLMIAKSI